MNSRPNPYVGPRSFRRDEKLFGRDRDVKTLLHLFVAERIVLLCSPSGAGKTSLLQAAFVPSLQERRFNVLSGEALVRVSTECPLEDTSRKEINRYVLSSLLSMEEGLPAQSRCSPAQLSQMTLKEYLDTRVRSNGGGSTPTLIFDQFEEILTLDPTDVTAKSEFFRQLGDALEDQRLWTLFSMREEYRAALDPYRELLPTRFHSTFRLDFLPLKDALKAMREPSLRAGVGFLPEAAVRLVDDLRRVKVQRINGPIEDQLGPYVEPVQLQVVCHSLWEGLSSEDNEIGLDDVERLGNVDSALSDYYGSSIRKIADEVKTTERQIRDWVEKCLISEHDLRTQVLLGEGSTNGLDNRVVDALKAVHLVRAEERGGRKWLELAHDRLVAPVKDSNKVWREKNLSFLAQCTELWVKQKRARSLLVADEELDRIQREYDAAATECTLEEKEFLAASRDAQVQIQREVRLGLLVKSLAIVSTLAAIVFLYQWIETNFMKQELALKWQETNRMKEKLTQTNNLATARLLASQARESEGDEPIGVRLLLAVEANNRANTLDVQTSLLAPLTIEKHLITSMYAGKVLIRSVATSNDGRTVASAGITEANEIVIWDKETKRKMFLPLRGHADWIPALAFSPSGKRLASGSADRSVIVWDAIKGQKELDQSEASKDIISSVAFLGTDDRLAFSSLDRRISIWDLKSGRRTLCGEHNAEVFYLAYNTGGVLASAGADKRVILWDIQNNGTCKPRGYLQHNEQVFSIAFNHDGTIAASGQQDGKIIIWDVVRKKPIGDALQAHQDRIFSLVFDREGDKLVSVSPDRTIQIWDVKERKAIRTIKTHEPLYAVSYDPSEDTVATGDSAGNIAFWRLDEQHPLGRSLGQLDSAAFSADLQFTALSSGKDTTVYKIPSSNHSSVNPYKKLSGIVGKHAVSASALSRDGRWVARATDDYVIEIWECRIDCQMRKSIQESGSVRNIFFLADNSFVYATSNGVIARRKIDADDEQVLARPRVPSSRYPPPLAVSRSGEAIAWYDEDKGVLKISKILTNNPLFSARISNVSNVALSESGERFAYSFEDPMTEVRNLVVQDTGTEKPSGSPWILKDPIYSLAFGPGDGKILALGTSKGVELWNIENLSQPEKLPRVLAYDHGDERVQQVNFSSDGSRLATFAQYGDTVIWDVDFTSWQTIACSIAAMNSQDRELTREKIRRNKSDSDGASSDSNICPEVLLEDSYEARLQGNEVDASKLLSKATNLALNSPSSLFTSSSFTNNVCWENLMLGNTHDALLVCKKAIERAPRDETDFYRDSLGVAKAMGGDMEGAVAEFRAFLKWKDRFVEYLDPTHRRIMESRAAKREKWIETLLQGRSPFDRKTIEELNRE